MPSPGDLPDPGIKLRSPALQAGSVFTWEGEYSADGNLNQYKPSVE